MSSASFGRFAIAAITIGASAVAIAAPPSAKDPRPIVGRNVFCSGCVSDEAGGGGGHGEGVIAESPLARSIALIATVVVPRSPGESRALVASLGSPPVAPPSLVRTGDRLLESGAEVVAIAPRRMVVRREGALEVLRIELPKPAATSAPSTTTSAPPPGVQCAAPDRCTVERAIVERTLADPTLLRGVQATPAMRDGQPIGWRLFGVARQPLVAALGLQNGDVITAVNGTPIPTVDALLGVYCRLRTATRLALTVERAGSTRTLDVTVR